MTGAVEHGGALTMPDPGPGCGASTIRNSATNLA
jgi:hypothetical protein